MKVPSVELSLCGCTEVSLAPRVGLCGLQPREQVACLLLVLGLLKQQRDVCLCRRGTRLRFLCSSLLRGGPCFGKLERALLRLGMKMPRHRQGRWSAGDRVRHESPHLGLLRRWGARAGRPALDFGNDTEGSDDLRTGACG